MRTEADIYLDYRSAMNQAEELEELGREVETLARQSFAELAQQLREAWSGENSAAFQVRLEQLAEKNQAVGKNFVRLAEALRRIAGNTYQAEREALEIAKTRSGG